MRYALLLCPLLLLGCTTTKGPTAPELKSGEPYRFQCDGCPKEKLMSGLKRIMVKNGWQVDSEDQEAGIMAFTKGLAPYEKIETSAFTEGMTGTSTAGQKGRLTFTFSENATSKDSVISRFEMGGQISAAINQEAGFTNQQSQATRKVAQGHPMMILYGKSIHRMEDRITLLSPDPARLPDSKYMASEN